LKNRAGGSAGSGGLCDIIRRIRDLYFITLLNFLKTESADPPHPADDVILSGGSAICIL
jgi:hypothetical protein